VRERGKKKVEGCGKRGEGGGKERAREGGREGELTIPNKMLQQKIIG
jgi:hypothetical protein